MNRQTSTVKLLRSMFFILIAVAIAGILSAIVLTSPVQADSPIYGRPGGDDTACIGIVNVDYQPSVAPLCAVKTLPRALSLAGAANSIIFDTGSQIITIPPNTSLTAFCDISAAAANLVGEKTDSPIMSV